MTISLPETNTAVGQDTFQTFVDKTNAAIDAISNSAVTVDQTANGSVTSGNAYITGTFGADTIRIATGLGGGNVQTSANLIFTTNVVFSSSANVFLATIRLSNAGINIGSNVSFNPTGLYFGNSTVNVVSNSTILSFSSNLILQSTGWAIGNSTVNSTINSSAITIGTGNFINVTANVVTANSFVGSGGLLSFTNVSANLVSANLVTGVAYSGNGQGLTGLLKTTSNLGDLTDASAARTQLGLGSAAVRADAYFQTALGYTPVNKAGDSGIGTLTMSGLTVTGTPTFSSGGIYCYGWGSNPAAGVVFLNSAGSRYLYFNGTDYNLPGAQLNTAAGRVWGTNDFSYPITDMRLTYAGDITIGSTETRDVWAGTVVTGYNFALRTVVTGVGYTTGTAITGVSYNPPPYSGGTASVTTTSGTFATSAYVSATTNVPYPNVERRRYVQAYKTNTGWYTIGYA